MELAMVFMDNIDIALHENKKESKSNAPRDMFDCTLATNLDPLRHGSEKRSRPVIHLILSYAASGVKLNEEYQSVSKIE